MRVSKNYEALVGSPYDTDHNKSGSIFGGPFGRGSLNRGPQLLSGLQLRPGSVERQCFKSQNDLFSVEGVQVSRPSGCWV